jgi:peptidyl-prolyl cis-trans isomerase D
MSVIQKIQEKYAKLMAIIIALALITFVVMLAFENGGTLFQGGDTNTIGKVNGEKLDNYEFFAKVDQMERNYKAQGYGEGDAVRQRVMEDVWNQEVNRLVLKAELEKLGMQIGKRELGDILYGANAPTDLKQNFTDPNTGVFNATAAKQQIDQLLKSGTPEQKASINMSILQLEFQRLTEKYNSLISNSVNVPRWFIEKDNADKSQMAKISFVRELYTSIQDTSIKISNAEIEDYISKHKKEFKQEESRSVAFVAFSALPTTADSTAARDKLVALRADFDSTKDMRQFLEMQGVRTFYDSYINQSVIQVPFKDSIFRTPVGGIYGPYLDGTNYSIAKVMGVRTQPDTVTIRHILIGTIRQDPKTGQQIPVRDSATAYKLADSISTAIRNGTSFDSLVVQFSDDEGSKANGGKYENVPPGQMVPEFNDFIFGRPVGSKGIVNTQFGSHYIEILTQKGASPAYKIAYLTQPIEASDETDQKASADATAFAASSRNAKSFDDNVQKLKDRKIFRMVENNIPPTGSQFQGVGTSRELVRNIYEAKKDEVLQEPVRVGDNYVVAMVTEINEAGTMSAEKARPQVEAVLRNQKKADLITKKLGTVSTLEAAAAALGNKPIEVVDSLRLTGQQTNAISTEPKVIGVSFNPANRGKVTPAISGTSGVYVVRVDNLSATALADANVPEIRKARIQEAKMMQQQSLMMGYGNSPLKDAASVKDYRRKFY